MATRRGSGSGRGTGRPSPRASRRAPAGRRERAAGPRNDRSELSARILAAIPAIGFGVLIVYFGGPLFAVGVTALAFVCLHELFLMYGSVRPARLAAMVAVIGLVLAAAAGGPSQVMLALAASIPVIFTVTALTPRRGDATVAMAITLLGVVWIGLAVAHAVMLRGLPHGGGIVVDVLVGTFVGDTGAYLGGRMWGRRPLAPGISPKKTLEGLLVGMAAAVAGVYFAKLYQDWLRPTDAVLLGVGVALSAPVGDLFESFVKRDAGAKDTGRMFGAHGGALDRLDAAIFALVVGYWVWRALL